MSLTYSMTPIALFVPARKPGAGCFDIKTYLKARDEKENYSGLSQVCVTRTNATPAGIQCRAYDIILAQFVKKGLNLSR